MPQLPKCWKFAPRIPSEADIELNEYAPVLRQILFNRGYKTKQSAQKFLDAAQPEGTEPQNMLGMLKATERINQAISKKELIAVYGDYDVDGVTATALLTRMLIALGANVEPFIPNRFDEGYGLNKESLKNLKDKGIRLVITVDCGIRSTPEVEYAHDINLDLIITDHHSPLNELPSAFAVINPKQPDDTYPEKNLAGVGLAYKLACALAGYADKLSPPPIKFPNDPKNPNFYLDLVALGTVADLVPLTGENRTLVKKGIEQLRNPHNQGILSLIMASGVNIDTINAYHIGFILGPRLNASGRLDTAMTSLSLLLSKDVYETGELAQFLDDQNRERQDITRQIQKDAEEIACIPDHDSYLLFASHKDFNPGVVGLAASRLCEQYYRPAIVAFQGDEYTRGSCRSIPEFDITKALDACAELMEHHGGHSAAAGFTIRNEKVEELVNRLQSIAQRELNTKDLRPKLDIDVEIPLKDLKPSILQYLDWMQPTGNSNEQPIFVSRNLIPLRKKQVGKDAAHLKMTVTDGMITYDAIAFRQGTWYENMPDRIDLAYTYERNEFNGRSSLQLNVVDIKPSNNTG
ncbi:MAG: single-stranded-DNA-specific exonuclease RecJ [Anaerolineales bacterium]|nr:single-stranded-DNA-specific exonuclease RecJ [Anaerolineales bacterium]